MQLFGKILAALTAVIAAIQTIARAIENPRPAITSTPHSSPPRSLTWAPLMGWECMACKRQRPDGFIGVTHMAVRGFEKHYPQTRLNYRHCTDRIECIDRALELKEAGGAGSS